MVSSLAVVGAAALTGCGLIAPLVRTALPLAGIKMAFACLPVSADKSVLDVSSPHGQTMRHAPGPVFPSDGDFIRGNVVPISRR